MELLTIGGGVQTIQKWMMSSLGMGESFAFYMTALVCVLAASVVSVGFMAVMTFTTTQREFRRSKVR